MMVRKTEEGFTPHLFSNYNFMKKFQIKRSITNHRKGAGFIALSSVLIIGAVIIVLGISIFYASLTDQSISTAYQSGQEAAFLADFCLKEGILRLKENVDYMGAEDIKVDDATCSVSLIEDIDDNTKKVSSLGRAGDQPHFSRSSQLIRYVIESEESDWESGEYDENFNEWTYLRNHEIIGAVLKTHESMNPVFVSCGNMISLQTAINVTFKFVKNHKLPKPLELANSLSKL